MEKAALAAAVSVEVSDNQALSSVVVLQVHEGQVFAKKLEQAAVRDLARCMDNSPLKSDSVKSRAPMPSRGRCTKGNVFIDSGLFE